MKNIYRIFFIAILMLAPAQAQAAEGSEPVVWASVDKNEVSIGDRVRYEVEVKTDGNTEAGLPKFAEDKIGDFEIKDSGSKDKKGLFGKRTLIYWYDIAAYTLGKHTIPRIEIKYKSKAAKSWAAVKTNTIEMTVRSVLPAAGVSDIRDIKGPLNLFNINWFIAALFIIALIAGAAAFFLYKKKKRAVPLKLAHETALEELEAIRGAYARGGEIKEYYVGISDCVRRYIERVFKMKAPEMTTEEFLNSLKGSGALQLEQKDLLKNFLSACDLVKFAKYAPSSAEAEAVFITARKFVEETKDVHI